jgi:hypothetical protein
MEYWPLVELGVLVAGGILVVISAFVTELGGPFARWWAERRNPFWDVEQSAAVRRWALRLNSRRSKVRMEAVERLGDLRDRTAVPALVRAVERYRTDARLLEVLVGVLRRLGDERAIPALRSLTSGRHLSLMQAAREAVAELEPKSVLLRAADSGDCGVLLRAAQGDNPDAARLLRVPRGGGPGE